MVKIAPVVGTAVALLLVGAPAAHGETAPERPVPAAARECPPLDPPPAPGDLETYVCGDRRLGPAELPEEGPVAVLVKGYEPLGGLSPVEFLDRWWVEDQVDPETGETWSGWDYPEHNGFVVVDGEPVNELRTLEPGAMLDRFGSPWGTFMAPAGDPYQARALPPDSLNTWPDGPEHNYNCYAVTTGITALVGPIAPHFEQPGGGEQLLVPAEEIPERGGDGFVAVNELLEWDYLERRPAEECVPNDRYYLAG
ncbi:TNT domain-containing protein [Nocardiopsis sp. EMB25]|uniref:TNT domain-containing protein n=1 Tax=Nocardiopsis sp. EMB25 TaxID=2835867 RepID=UPI00228353FB|nr:TNT domain-containing protein [Nocardiopsis sp. EMB25]MCY9785687.1 TNT domain-containing protein [Nocardiopsis sp. EMB25]